jgi:hypothetical protein
MKRFRSGRSFAPGLQTETILGSELSAAYRDALAVLERTSAELRASEFLRLAASAQQQWVASNRVPFAEIVTYGTEASITPVKASVLKLQAEWQQHDEFAATASEQDTYRLALEQELIPKRLRASVGVAFVHFDDENLADRESFARKLDTALRWTPIEQTSLTLGAELADQAALHAGSSSGAYAVKLQRRLARRTKLELQAGYEQRTLESLDARSSNEVWNLGAQSDFTLRDDLAAGLGLRYRQRHDSLFPRPEDEVSLSLSVKGRF